MRIALQSALGTPQDWQMLAITKDGDWRSLPKKPHPTEGDPGTMQADAGPDFGIQTVLDPSHPTADDPGWLNSINVLGCEYSPDHLHITFSGGRLTLTYWNDGPLWAGNRHAEEWTIGLPTWDGQRQVASQNVTKRIWYEDPVVGAKRLAGDVLATAPWSSFSEPGPANMVMHSVWLQGRGADSHTGEPERAASGQAVLDFYGEPTPWLDGYTGWVFLWVDGREMPNQENMPRTEVAWVEAGIRYPALWPTHPPETNVTCSVCGKETSLLDRHEAAKSEMGLAPPGAWTTRQEQLAAMLARWS
jgi:hypothetical protein